MSGRLGPLSSFSLRNYTKDQLFKQNAIWWLSLPRSLCGSVGRPRTSRLFGGHTNARTKKKFRSAPRVFSFASSSSSSTDQRRRKKVDDQILRPKNFRDFIFPSSRQERSEQWQLFNPLCPSIPFFQPLLFFLSFFFTLVRFRKLCFMLIGLLPLSSLAPLFPPLGMMAPKDEGGREKREGLCSFPPFFFQSSPLFPATPISFLVLLT